VAVLRVSLAAEQCDPVAPRTGNEALYRSLESLLFGHRAVEGVAVRVVVLVSRRTASELLPEEQIAHAPSSHRGLELIPIEMWREARVGERPHIYKELDLPT
jgi:hypothetical protein